MSQCFENNILYPTEYEYQQDRIVTYIGDFITVCFVSVKVLKMYFALFYMFIKF